MTAEERARAFDRFWQSGGARRDGRPNGHFGLGLAIVRELVVADGGDVAARAVGRRRARGRGADEAERRPGGAACPSALDGLGDVIERCRVDDVGVTDAGPVDEVGEREPLEDLAGLVGDADPDLLQDAVALAVVVLAHAGW